MKTRLLKRLRKAANEKIRMKELKSGFIIYYGLVEVASFEKNNLVEALKYLDEHRREYILRKLHEGYCCHYYKE